MTWHIHGHDWAVSLLRTHAASGTFRHSYLLTGPEGVGRRTLALRFAMALNCTNPPSPGDYCDICRDCRQIAAMAYPDLSLLQPEAGHKDILIDQVRELQHTLALSPYTARRRIALLPDYQRATNQASNALLKTLEEPPDKVVLLLTADGVESLLPTIVSRCEVIRLRPASLAAAQAYIQTEKGLPPEKAHLLAHLSGGRIGAANHLADDPDALSHRQEILETFLALLSAPLYERFKLAESLSRPYDQARANAGEVIPAWLTFWRDVFGRASGAELPLVNIDYAEQVGRTAAALYLQTARELVTLHEEALKHLNANANVRLLLENLMLRWPQIEPLLQPA